MVESRVKAGAAECVVGPLSGNLVTEVGLSTLDMSVGYHTVGIKKPHEPLPSGVESEGK